MLGGGSHPPKSVTTDWHLSMSNPEKTKGHRSCMAWLHSISGQMCRYKLLGSQSDYWSSSSQERVHIRTFSKDRSSSFNLADMSFKLLVTSQTGNSSEIFGVKIMNNYFSSIIFRPQTPLQLPKKKRSSASTVFFGAGLAPVNENGLHRIYPSATDLTDLPGKIWNP